MLIFSYQKPRNHECRHHLQSKSWKSSGGCKSRKSSGGCKMLRFFEFLCLALCLQIVICRPAEEPTKFSLNGSVQSVETSKVQEDIGTSKFQQGMEFLGSIADKIRFGRGRLVNSIILVTNIFKEGGEDWVNQIADVMKIRRLNNSVTLARSNFINRTEEVASESQNTVTSVLSQKNDVLSQGKATLQSYEKAPFANFLPPRTRETVRLEHESGQGLLEKPKSNPIEGVLENFLRPTPIVDGIKEEQKYGNSGDKFIGIGRVLVNGFEGLSNFLNLVVDLPVKAAKQTSRGITEALNQLGARLIGLQ